MRKSLRVLVTGATGSAGSHLCELALAGGAEVCGLARDQDFPKGITGITGDLTIPGVAAACVERSRPHRIFHLAAAVHGSSPASPDEMFRTNVGGTFQLLDAARRLVPDARILVAGSSGIYASPDDPEKPVKESDPMGPRSAYASSKAAQDLVAAQFSLGGLHVVRTRTFNQTGPREPKGLVCATLARRIAALEQSRGPQILEVRDLDAARDFCDVRDVVRAYWALLESGRPGLAYNVCSGRATSIREIARVILAASECAGAMVCGIPAESGSPSLRKQLGDCSLLCRDTGWSPQIPLAASLADLLTEWRGRLAGAYE